MAGQHPSSFSTLSPSAWPLVTTFYGLLDLYNPDIPSPFQFGAVTPATARQRSCQQHIQQPRGALHQLHDGAADAADASDTSDEDSDIDNAYEEGQHGLPGAPPPPQAHLISRDALQQEVTLPIFVSHYWPHLSQESVKASGCGADQIWAEIQSCIKGGSAAVQQSKGRLSVQSYVAMAEQRTSELSAAQRTALFSCFQQYEQRRRERQEWDMAGYTGHVFHQLCALEKTRQLPVQVE